ncbi:RNA helicase required for poly(A+) mRNA export [Mortierella alpina]|uniref:RNA helicase n=1 Tax=Mortierella alpina TaxID=64518 RepID=A0A9P6J4T9_MORAP|nr:RNA helicase required for poly(A+) mRNA export [Mortierella alpina]
MSLSDLVDSIEEVEVQQTDQNSPLHSVKSFEDLNMNANLLKGIYNAKFAKPSKIQEHALPLLLRDPPEHLIAQAESGTGKTASFSLAVLTRLNRDDPSAQALILAPTRELAKQIVGVIKELAKFTTATITTIVRQEQGGSLPERVDGQIIVGTPGSVGDLIKRRKLGVSGIKTLVLDEADYMLDLQGLREQTLHIQRYLPRSIQLVLFSATWDYRITQFTEQFVRGPRNHIRLPVDKLTVKTIRQFYIDCEDEEDRFEMLVALYSIMTISQSIIFVERRDTADKIARRMRNRHHAVSYLHGALTPNERDDIIADFRSMKSKVLITTNVLARGIDISTVNLVINYDLPKTRDTDDNRVVPDPVTYLHRMGRTGRFGRRGVCVNFIHDRISFEDLQEIENYYKCEIRRVPIAPLCEYGTSLEEQKEARIDKMEEFFKQAMKNV